MSAPIVRREQVISTDVPLGPGQRTVRVSRSLKHLIIADGLCEDGRFERPGWLGPPLIVPVSAIAGLRAALEALEAEGQ